MDWGHTFIGNMILGRHHENDIPYSMYEEECKEELDRMLNNIGCHASEFIDAILETVSEDYESKLEKLEKRIEQLENAPC